MQNFAAKFRGVWWIPLAALFLSWLLSLTPIYERLSALLDDTVKGWAAQSQQFTDVVVIDIDDPSLTIMQPYFGGWPYQRSTYAQFVDFLGEMGARAVVFDLVLSDPREGDEDFRSAIARNANVVLATAARSDSAPEPKIRSLLQGLSWQVPDHLPAEPWPSAQMPLPSFTQPAPSYARIGIVSAIPDSDGVLRRIPLFHQINGEYLPTLPLAGHFPTGPQPPVRLNSHAEMQIGTLSAPIDAEGMAHLYFPSNPNDVLGMPFSRVAQAMLGAPGQDIDPATFRGKTVFLGSSAFFTDRVLTPVGEMRGVHVLALVHQALAKGLLLKPRQRLWSGVALLLALLPTAWLLFRPKRTVRSATLASTGVAAFLLLVNFVLLRSDRQQNLLLLPLLILAFGLLIEVVRTLRIVRAKRAAQIQALTNDDPLTGLPNRLSLQTQLAQAIEVARPRAEGLAVILVNLDHFKSINNALGQAAGDQLLIEVKNRLKLSLRAQDFAARLGSDSFALVFRGADQLAAAHHADLALGALGRPYHLANQQVHVTASLGISLFPKDGADEAALVQNADTALHHAKEEGRNTYRFFTPELSKSINEQMQIENQLRHALAHDELVLHYQPQLDIATNRIVSFEALIRWNHPERGLLSPFHFIAIAEKSDLILAVDEWVLNAACRQLQTWHLAGLTHIKQVAVNLSARQFDQSNLPSLVAEALARSGLAPQHLELEITESLAMKNPQHTIATLNTLKSMGVTLAMDDFGTGHSSFSYLKHFPIDIVKVDQSFVKGIEEDKYDAEICAATISLANNLGLETVAEGVETAKQLAILKTLNCVKVQGYFINRPIPVNEVTRLYGAELSAA